MEPQSETDRDKTEATASRLRATQDELVAALREWVYVTFTGLAVLLTFEVERADASVWTVATTLLIGIVGAAFADCPGHFPNRSQTVAVLVAAGADVNARVVHPGPPASSETPLHWAASNDDVDLVDALLDAGADIEAAGAIFTGGPPMSDAVVLGQWRAARRLLDRGATTTVWQAAALGCTDRVRDLCQVEPAPLREHLTNAFWNACRGGQRPTTEYLLERGADLNWVGHDGKTSCDVAQESSDDQLLAWLRARGARRASELE